MPVDTTRVVSPRRTQKKLTEEELKDIDRKRLLGELSCAECRRLKLRCDKKLPCGSCYRRGCESICPLGILAAGQGTRFILADTEQLHEKIYEMSNRIRQLEDALAILQSTVSDQRHPLLSDELLKIKFGSEAINARQNQTSDEDDPTSKSIDALGTLTLGSSGEMQYFGRSAGSETLMMRAGEEAEELSDNDEQNVTQTPFDKLREVDKLANLFPFSIKTRPNAKGLELVKTCLPSHERALQLCDLYVNHASYFFRPIKSEELLNVLLVSVYNKVSNNDQALPKGFDRDSGDIVTNIPHALATLYFVFSLGCLLDLQLSPFNEEAERYYDLGRASLSLRSVYDSPNMFSVKAMGLMATYHSLAGKKYSRDSAWCVMSFAAKLAQSIGLHRDSARWKMDNKTVQKRRNLFWEVFSADISHSLALGRPPASHLSYVDCEFPQDDDASLSEAAEHQTGFWRMKHIFARDIYNSVADTTLTARSPSYSTILDLDRKVREISFPPSFNPYVSRDVGPEIFHSSSLSLRDFYASQHRTVTMLYLHRSFFAQAMLDHPTNPLLSPFAPSFLTAYRSASVVIKACAHHFERCAPMAMRLWFLMNHTFSAAVIVGTVVTRSPNSNIAPVALRDFNLALSLFEKTAEQSQRAKVALGILLKLKDKATQIYEQYSTGNLGSATPQSSVMTDDIEDDLAIFGGQMKVLDRKGKAHRRSASSPAGSSGSSPQPTSSGAISPVSGSSALNFGLPDVHPSLIAYLNQDAVKKTMAADAANRGIHSGLAPILEHRALPPPAPTQIDIGGGIQSSSRAYEPAYEASQMQSRTMPSPSEHSSSQSDSIPANSAAQTNSITQPHFSPSPSPHTSRYIQPHQYISIPESSSIDWPASSVPREQPMHYEFSNTVSQNFSGRAQMDHSRTLSSRPEQVSLPRLGAVIQSSTPGVNTPPNTAITQGFGPSSSYPSNSAPFRTGVDYPTYSFAGESGAYGSANPTVMPGANPNIDFWSNQRLNSMDTNGAVEMGLSSESGMDAGWISFMRDCGIMDMSEDR